MFAVCWVLFLGVSFIATNENVTSTIQSQHESDEGQFTFEVNLNATPELNETLPDYYKVSHTYFDDVPFRYPERNEQLRRRRKEERLIFIQRQIMATLGPVNRSNTSNNLISEDERNRIVMKFEQFRTQMQNNGVSSTQQMYAEKVQSFYPSCTIPRNTDADAWENGNHFHLYYDIISPRHEFVDAINVSSATLRLYKNGKFVENMVKDDNFFVDETVPPRQLSNDALRITVFQYLRPLRQNRRAKKKELDSKLISIYEEGWIEFDIQSSIIDWFENGNKNFGLEIVLEDQDSVSQNPSDFIRKMNCSQHNANNPPFPRFMDDEASQGENNSSFFDNETFPTLDLHTIEYPKKFLSIEHNESEVRTRRNSGCDDIDFDCSLETSYITFRDLGWEEWITKPEGFHIQYCIGSCKKTSTPVSDLENDYEKECVPKELESLQLQYNDNSRTRFVTEITDFFIKSCTCVNTVK